MASKVYYMDARSRSAQTGLVPKMLTCFDAAGLGDLIQPNDLVAIKLHCGEWNNTAYLRPVYARALADKVKQLGGRPFVCDTGTLPYAPRASRVSAVDFYYTAERNGFNSATMGCPFLCADGFLGTDDLRVDLPEGYILKEAYIASAIAAADVLIVLSHFKGHPMSGMAGAIKNLGIGAQSKRGKFNVHMGRHPNYGYDQAVLHTEKITQNNIDEIRDVVDGLCPFDLFRVEDDTLKWDRAKCTNCLACLEPLVSRGILELAPKNFEASCAAIADACLATVKTVGRDKVGFINLALDISPLCDCVDFSDAAFVPNQGIFASTDPVALDKACTDLVDKAAGLHGTAAQDSSAEAPGLHKFEKIATPAVHGMKQDIQVNTGEIIGLGSKSYELIEVAPVADGEGFFFSPDARKVGTRFGRKFEKMNVFPVDRHNGRGYDRKSEIDLKKINKDDA